MTRAATSSEHQPDRDVRRPAHGPRPRSGTPATTNGRGMLARSWWFQCAVPLAVACGECQRDRRGTVPTYQYACTECGHAFDQFQSFSDDALTECPECQGRLRKVFNAVGVVFKGSGFYRNDSRDKKSSGVSSESKSDGKSETKSDSGTRAAPSPRRSRRRSPTPPRRAAPRLPPPPSHWPVESGPTASATGLRSSRARPLAARPPATRRTPRGAVAGAGPSPRCWPPPPWSPGCTSCAPPPPDVVAVLDGRP